MPLISSGVEDRVLSLLFPSNAVCIAGTQVGRERDNGFDYESRVGMGEGDIISDERKGSDKGEIVPGALGAICDCSTSRMMSLGLAAEARNRPIIPFSPIIHHTRPI